MRTSLTLACIAALLLGCAAPAEKTASTAETKTAPATPAATPPATGKNEACKPPPKDLVVKDITEGTGQTVRVRSAVLVNYTGWVYDGCAADFKGKEFDTSKNRQTPFGFTVGARRVIRGWDEGLIGMKEKGKRLLIIPPGMAYGDRSPTPLIPPNSTLVFEVELVQIIYQPGEPAK